MFRHEVFLLLSEVTEVLGRAAGEDLTRWDSGTLGEDCTSGHDSEGLDLGVAGDSRSHANKRVVLESACIERHIGSNVNVLTNDNSVASLLGRASDVNLVLNGSVLADRDLGGISTDDDAVPERGSLTEANISDHGSVRSNPITLIKSRKQVSTIGDGKVMRARDLHLEDGGIWRLRRRRI